MGEYLQVARQAIRAGLGLGPRRDMSPEARLHAAWVKVLGCWLEDCPVVCAGWRSTGWFRAVLSDGTVWAESSDEQEVRERWEQIRTQAVKIYPPSGEKTYGPDPDARLEHLWERRQSEWRKCGFHDNCPANAG